MEPGKLLLVSDLEGCSPLSASKQPQSQLLCKPEFFAAVAAFLENPKNKVAFLGDYFDQGPYVVDSINGIMELKKTYGPRIHIILGNRDLNKFRLVYEMQQTAQQIGQNKWADWSKFYNELNPEAPLLDRLKHILNTSMGAPGPLNLAPSEELSPEEAAYLFVRAFSEPAASLLPNAAAAKSKIEGTPKFASFINNVRGLFTEGKIVTLDSDFKTLLSHAGGAEPFLFHNINYYTAIKSTLSKAATYFDKIETVRLGLQELPAEDAVADHFNDQVYNEPLTCVPSLFDDTNPSPPDDYFLLQGLGLKPNPNRHFNSFIQSCDIKGCKGPYGPDIPLDPHVSYETYLGLLAASGVSVIAFGHAPHCVPIPVIYKRPESEILFIGNDTSNGYRPSAIEAINQIPLSYVSLTAEGIKAGVFSLPGTSKYTYDGGSMFASMIGTWDPSTAPKFLMDPPRIQYEGKALLFPARSEKTFPGIFKPATMEGGAKRKSKKRSSNKRRTKKQSLY